MEFFEIGTRKIAVKESMLTDEIAWEMENGEYEDAERRLIRKYFPNYKLFPVIEIGAGVGAVTANIQDIAQRKHVAVEPDPRAYSALAENVHHHDLMVHMVNAAYSPDREFVHLRMSKDYWISSVLEDHEMEEISRYGVKSVSLEWLKDAHRIEDFVLIMDAEGAERFLTEEKEEMESCQLFIAELHPREEDGEVDPSWVTEEFDLELLEEDDGAFAFKKPTE